jgi:hypothetical protein
MAMSASSTTPSGSVVPMEVERSMLEERVTRARSQAIGNPTPESMRAYGWAIMDYWDAVATSDCVSVPGGHQSAP